MAWLQLTPLKPLKHLWEIFFFLSVATLKCKKYIHLFYLNKSKDKTNRQKEGTVIPPSPTFTLRNLIESVRGGHVGGVNNKNIFA